MQIPAVIPRRPLDDDRPDGYLESDRDFAENNWDFVMWALNNHEWIRRVQQSVQTDSWAGCVDRSGGSFEDWEINRNNWR